MAEAYETMKAVELRALLKSKHGNEPAKGMLKSAMITLLLELDAKAEASSAAPVAAKKAAEPVEAAPVAKKTEKTPTKKTAVAPKATSAKSEPPVASAAPVKTATAAPAKQSAKPTASATKVTSAAAATTAATSQQAKKESAPSSAPAASSSTDGYNPMSADALARRAQRFGRTPERDAQASRAERFGTHFEDDNPLMKRAEEAKKAEEEAKQKAKDLADKNARAARFGMPLTLDPDLENEKKRARQDRFKTDLANKKPKLSEMQ